MSGAATVGSFVINMSAPTAGLKADLADATNSVKTSSQNIVNAWAGVTAETDRASYAGMKLVAGLKDEIATFGMTSQQLTQYRANLSGVGTEAQALIARLQKMKESSTAFGEEAQKTAAPMIAKLAEVERGVGRVGISAAQTAAAMRGVPAQMTDIVVSLQAGQNPMTVLLQQGGQLKDMFGGVGPAAKAMGTYVVGLVNPLTLAAAATGVLAIAYHEGSKESDAYTKALVLTGNVAGTTAGQLQGMAANISKSIGTQGGAAAALAELAGTGKVAAVNLENFASVAVKMEKTVGQSVADTAKDFAELGKSPVDASEKLNDKYHYLTASVYAQISALQEQGRMEDAASIAQKTFAAAMDDRTKQLMGNLGSIERGWNAITAAAKSGWDSILGVGRQKTTKDDLADVSSQIESYNPFSVMGPNLDTLKARKEALEETIRLEGRGAAATAASAAQEQARIAFMKEGDKYLSKAAITEREIAMARMQGAAAGLDAAVIEKRVADIRATNADKSSAAVINKEASAYAGLIASIKTKTEENKLEALVGLNATESQKISIKLTQDLASGKVKLSKEHIATARAALVEMAASEKLLKTQATEKDVAKYIEQSTLARKDSAAQLAVEYQLYGQSNDARDIAMVAIKEQTVLEKFLLVEKEAGKTITEEQIARLTEEASARTKVGQTTLAQSKALSYANQLAGENKRFAAESIFDDKARAAALLEIDAGAWRERIRLAGDGTDAQKKLQGEFDTWYANQSIKPALDQQKNMWKSIDQTAHDTFVNIFDGGKNAFDKLRDTLKAGLLDLLYQMMIKKWIFNIGASVTGGGISSVANAATSGGIGGSMNMLSAGKSLWDGFSGGMTAGMGSGIAAVGNAFGASSVSAFGAGLAGNTSVGLMTASETFASAGMAAEASAASLGASVAAAVPYIAAAAAVAYVLKAGFGHGERETTSRGIEGSFGGSGFTGNNFNVWKEEGGWFSGDNNGRDTSALDAATAKQFSSGYATLQSASINAAKALGLSADSISSYSEQISLVLTGDKAKDAEAITKLFADLGDHMATAAAPGIDAFAKEGEAASATLARLSGSITSANAWLSMLRQRLFQVSLAGGDAASKLADAFGGLDSLTAASKAFYDTYYTEGERAARSSADMTAALALVNLSMPETKDQLRALASSLDLNTESGRAAYVTLLAIAPEFAAVADITARLAKETADKLISTFTGGGQLMPALSTAANYFDALTGSIGITTGNAISLKDQAWAMGLQLFDAAGKATGLSGAVMTVGQYADGTAGTMYGLNDSVWQVGVHADGARGLMFALTDAVWAVGANAVGTAGTMYGLNDSVWTVGQYADGTRGILYAMNDAVWQVGVHADGARGLMFALTDAVWAVGANAVGTAGTMYGLNDSVWTVGQYADGTRGALYSLNDSVWQVGVHADGTRGLMFALTDAVWAVGANANGTSAAVAGFSDSIGFMVPVLTSTAAAAGYVSLLFTGAQSGLLSFGDNVSLLSPVFDKTGNSAGTIASVMAGAEFGIASFGGATVSFGNDVAGLIPSVNGAGDAVGSISTRFLDVQSGLISFDGSTATLQTTFTGAQLAGLLLNNEIDDLRLGADKTRIDIAGLGDALAGVNIDTFITTMGLVFANLATRIQGVIDSIGSERVAVREAALQIINPTVMSKDAIQRGIGSINTSLPSSAGVAQAQAGLGAIDKQVAANNANLSAQRGLLNSYNDQLSANRNWLAQTNNARASESAYANLVRADLAKLAGNRATAARNALMAKDNSELARVAAEMVQFDAATNAANANINSLTNSVANQQAVVNQAAAVTNQSIADQGWWVNYAKAQQLAYTNALQNFGVDASKSVGKLGKLREETVKYYDAQKQLADLMTKSAAGLRDTVAAYKYSQLSPQQQFDDLQAKYATAYSMALSTDGESLAGYGDKLNSMLNPLLEKAKEIYGSDSAYNAFAATALARAETIAGRLETLTPTNYAADSLAMLGSIDATLAALDASSKSAERIISDAVNAGSEKTAGGLRAVIAALTGQAIPGFATGGDFGGGLRIVGENGPELEATGPSRIFNASQTRAMLSGGGDTARLEALVERQTQELANMRAELRAIVLNTGKSVRQGDKIDREGLTVLTDADLAAAYEAA